MFSHFLSAILQIFKSFLSVLNLYKPINSLNSLIIKLSTCLLCSIVLSSHLVDSIFVIKKEKKKKEFLGPNP